jgi:glycosyltransferase involved in cell wall biosynthesis
MKTKLKRILWWGRFDPEYSRNRILRCLLREMGYVIYDFHPKVSFLGQLESFFSNIPEVDAVWVPCFRQRDFDAAHRFAKKRKVPVIFDPLISVWDKIVFEREKFSEEAPKSSKLKSWERSLFERSDVTLADTTLHADLFIKTLGATPDKTFVVPVGAEEELFNEQPFSQSSSQLEVLFYGSFINLQGPTVIAEAAKLVPKAKFTFLGEGPLQKQCREITKGLPNVHFEDWIAYEKLPGRIGQADVLLGVFGGSPKAGRVIPNKVYQALACARPVITRYSEAFPKELQKGQPGLRLVAPSSPKDLAAAISESIDNLAQMQEYGRSARLTYEEYFSYANLRNDLQKFLKSGLGW